MIPEGQRFPYLEIENARGDIALRPLLPLTLNYQDRSVETVGLLDTGADINVLPYQLGVDLGAVWTEQRTSLVLSGNLANFEARGLIVTAVIGQFAPVRLAFAWTQAENVPLLLGQVNFFMRFNIGFYRSQSFFVVDPSKDE